MALVLNTNIASLNAQQALQSSSTTLNTSLQRLSTGLQINSAKDDAAGLAISQRMTAQINGEGQAIKNSNDAISLSQTGEGALGQMGNLLQTIRTLAVQAANGTNSASDRQSINQEVTQLSSELDRFAQTTNFNNINLFDGSNASTTFQVGANANQTITTTTANFRTSNYGAQQLGNSTNSHAVSGASAPVTGAVISTSGTINLKGGAASGSISVTTSDSAYSIAQKINAQSQTGISASAQTVTTLTFSASGSYSLNVTGSNTSAQQVTFNLTAKNTASGLADAVTEFNNQSGVTGVTAALNTTGTAVVLTSSEGDNISLSASGGTAGTITAGTTAGGGQSTIVSGSSTGITIGGNLTLDSSVAYTVTSAGAVAGANAFGSALGANASLSSTLQSVSSLNTLSASGATQAIRIVDAALTAVNSQRAAYGALQNRFSATVSNLQTTSNNLSAARAAPGSA